MLVKFNKISGAAGGTDRLLTISTQDAVDVPLLVQLFHEVPPSVRATISMERAGDYASGTLYLTWDRSDKAPNLPCCPGFEAGRAHDEWCHKMQ